MERNERKIFYLMNMNCCAVKIFKCSLLVSNQNFRCLHFGAWVNLVLSYKYSLCLYCQQYMFTKVSTHKNQGEQIAQWFLKKKAYEHIPGSSIFQLIFCTVFYLLWLNRVILNVKRLRLHCHFFQLAFSWDRRTILQKFILVSSIVLDIYTYCKAKEAVHSLYCSIQEVNVVLFRFRLI